MDRLLLEALTTGILLLAGAAVAITLWSRRGQSQGPRMPPALAWQAAAPSLQALGMHALDAETYTFRLPSGGTLYVKLELREASLRAWQDSRCGGGPLEGMLGGEAEIRPGESGRSETERFVAATVREIRGQLPRTACLSVKAPEIRGDSYKANLTTPFSSPEQAATVARVLHALDEAVRGQAR